MNGNLFFQLLANGFVQGAIYSLLAVGFGILYRSLRFFDISYGALYTVAPYFMYVLTRTLKLNYFLAFVSSIVLTALVAILFEKAMYLNFYKKSASPAVMLVASLGVYIFVENLVAIIFGNEIKMLSSGGETSFTFFKIIITRIQLYQFMVGLFLTLCLLILVKKNKYLKALWALGDEPELIEVLGLPLNSLRVLAFIVASVFAGTASILTFQDVGINPHGGMEVLLSAAVIVIVGGIDSIVGWIIGAYVLATIQSLVIFQFAPRWTPLVTFGLLILILLVRPQGILGLKRRLEE